MAMGEGDNTGPKIADFLLALSTDPELLARYENDSEAVLRESNLADFQKDILRTNEVALIRQAVYDEVGDYFALGIIKIVIKIIK
jgi:hypothetical protein